MAKQKFSHESIQDVASVRKYLKSLIRSIDAGKLTLTSEEEKIDLKMRDLMQFSIKAKKNGRKNKLTLELNWTDKTELPVDDDSRPVKISS